MSAIVIIPARGGSKGLPGKNLARVGGVPLVSRAVAAARSASGVETVVVSTDDDDIAAVAAGVGAVVVRRPMELAGDEASSESAVLHAIGKLSDDGYDIPPVTVLLQCTSPFIPSVALAEAVEIVQSGRAHVAFSVVESHAFLWADGPQGMEGVNHDSSVRLRRQDRTPEFRETGAFYAMSTQGLQEHGHRFFGHIRGVLVPEATSVEIDTEADLALARMLASETPMPPLIDVDALVTDFDGVHTDDRAWVDQDGREMVAVSRADGLGLAALRAARVPVLIISKETNPVVAARAAKLGLPVLQAIDDKAQALQTWIDEHQLDPQRIAYVGNDINDLPAMALVGWPIAVRESHPRVRRAARMVLSKPSGAGALRELCERILQAVEARR